MVNDRSDIHSGAGQNSTYKECEEEDKHGDYIVASQG
jgi:hypothetical protein